MSIYRRVLRYYRPFLGQTIFGLFLSFVGIALNLLKPWPFKVIVDDFLRPGPSARSDWHTWIPLLCLALILIQLFWGMMNWITNYLFVKIGLQALLKLRTDLYSYLQSLSLSNFMTRAVRAIPFSALCATRTRSRRSTIKVSTTSFHLISF